MKEFTLKDAIEILERTPAVMKSLLSGLSESWIINTEGADSWSPFDILGHLIHGEKTDWISRTKLVLENNKKTFEPFDRFAQFTSSKGKTISELLDEFKKLRTKNLNALNELNISDEDLIKTGMHPNFGEVNLKQLLSTWAVHDLGHIRQTVRVMAKQYKKEVGPWEKYLPILNE